MLSAIPLWELATALQWWVANKACSQKYFPGKVRIKSTELLENNGDKDMGEGSCWKYTTKVKFGK